MSPIVSGVSGTADTTVSQRDNISWSWSVGKSSATSGAVVARTRRSARREHGDVERCQSSGDRGVDGAEPDEPDGGAGELAAVERRPSDVRCCSSSSSRKRLRSWRSRPITNSAIATALLPALVVRRMPASARPADCSCADPAPTPCTHASFGAMSPTSNGRSSASTASTRCEHRPLRVGERRARVREPLRRPRFAHARFVARAVRRTSRRSRRGADRSTGRSRSPARVHRHRRTTRWDTGCRG